MYNIFMWDENFPKGYGHTSISFLKKCKGYDEAKKGSLEDAFSVVSQCVKPYKIKELTRSYPSAILLPIISSNKLPTALAMNIGLPIYFGVSLISHYKRKKMTGMERILHKPNFTGFVPSGLCFIIVDDVVTQGGTIASLRNFVLSFGSTIVAVVALAYASGSSQIAPLNKNISKLIERFSVNDILRINDYIKDVDCIWAMTNSQIIYLLKFKNINSLYSKIMLSLNEKKAA